MTARLQSDNLNSFSGSIDIIGDNLDLSNTKSGLILPNGEASTEGSPAYNALRLETQTDEDGITSGLLKVFNNDNEWKEIVDTTSPYASSKVSLVKDQLVFYVDTSQPSSYPGSGDTWFDLSGNGYNVVFPTLPVWQGTYFDFDGSTHRGYVEGLIYGSTSKQISEGTFAFMVRTTYDDGSGATWNNANWSIIDWDRSETFSVNLGGGGAINFAGRSSNTGGIGGTYYDIAGNGLYNDNQWHYIAVTFSVADQKLIMYADGEVDREFLANGNMTPLGFGVNRYGWIGDGSEASSPGAGANNIYFDGDLGVVQIYEKALSEQEIRNNYNVLRTRFV